MNPNEAPFPLTGMDDPVQRAFTTITSLLLPPAHFLYLSPNKGFKMLTNWLIRTRSSQFQGDIRSSTYWVSKWSIIFCYTDNTSEDIFFCSSSKQLVWFNNSYESVQCLKFKYSITNLNRIHHPKIPNTFTKNVAQTGVGWVWPAFTICFLRA